MDTRVVLVRDPHDAVAASAPAFWAADQLAQALLGHGLQVEHGPRLEAGDAALAPRSRPIRLSGFAAPAAQASFRRAGLAVPEVPEALAIMPAPDQLIVAGYDARGLVYATLELVDRLATTRDADPLAALQIERPIVQRPANAIRGVARLFVSDVEDLPWFYDRDFWRAYLSELVTQRFNRIHLAFGIGHDFLRNVLDAYLLFAYPFLVDVPGYDVHVPGLSDTERQRNLEALRFASDAAAARGLHFQLGLWTHGSTWTDSPNANYTIEGLSPSNHAAYCRDAIRLLLESCPSIAGVTLRVHGESGVPEGSEDFWREVFSGVASCGRTVELDLHPKGVGAALIQVGLETGLPVTLSPKYTAEHMGLPGHQVAIRELERSGDPFRTPDPFVERLMNQSGEGLRYTRYGVADFLRTDRRYGVFSRIWPGTQRFLLWGDPALAAGFGRAGSFCGSLGVEVCEPLSFKGRRGSGLPGGREGYADASLRQDGGADWQKYRLTYRLFGRLLYDPAEDPSVWRRALAAAFGPAAAAPVETALAHASRILPLVTSAYHPSAANNHYWPELYTTLPIVDADRPHPYRDTPTPRRLGTASPLDPGLFSGVEAFVQELTTHAASGRISPLRVAATLDRLAETALRGLAQAEQCVASPSTPTFRRLAIDVAIQAALGQFFADTLRAAVAYAVWQTTGERARLRQALDHYTAARAAWAHAAEHGRVYRADLTVGGEPWLRGHWSDRLPAIDADLADMQAEWDRLPAAGETPLAPAPTLDALEPPPPAIDVQHVPAAAFQPGQPVTVEVTVAPADPETPLRLVLHYRHVNQAETYASQPMQAVAPATYRAVIPASYTASPFALQYLVVVLQQPSGKVGRAPDLAADLANQPYWVVPQTIPD